jgi:PQQ-like domain
MLMIRTLAFAALLTACRAQLDSTAAWPTFLNDSQRTGRGAYYGPIDPKVQSTIIWKSSVYSKDLLEKDSTSMVRSPIIISGPALGAKRLVIFGSQDGVVRAVDGDAINNVVWSFQTGGAIHGGVSLGVGGYVFFGSADTKIYGLKMAKPNITEWWAYKTQKAVYTSPLLLPNGNVVVTSSDKVVYALNFSGHLQWNTSLTFPGDPSTTGGYYDPVKYSAALDPSRSIIYQPCGNLLAALDGATGVIQFSGQVRGYTFDW